MKTFHPNVNCNNLQRETCSVLLHLVKSWLQVLSFRGDNKMKTVFPVYYPKHYLQTLWLLGYTRWDCGNGNFLTYVCVQMCFQKI